MTSGARQTLANVRIAAHDARPMPGSLSDPLRWLRVVSLTEAVSYLLLLGIAMPLKWIWDRPEAVRIVGMAHGVLFLLLIWFLLRARFERNWPVPRLVLVFVASFVPFWPFLLERRLREWSAATEASSA